MAESKGETLMRAMRAVRIAEANLGATIKTLWPEGSDVSWQKGRSTSPLIGTVIHTGDGSLRVRNQRTGKEYWISAYDVLCGLGLDQRYHEERRSAQP